MADEPGTAPAAPASTDPPAGEPGKTFTQEEFNALLAREKGNLQRKYDGFDDLKAKADKFDELEASQRSDLEKVTGERDELKNQLTPLQTENLRLRVAAQKKLPAELIDRLKGGTKDEMEKDADELLKLVGVSQPPPDFGGGPREPAPANDFDALIRGSRK